MSLEVTVITSLLATALGSSKVAESVVELFKKYYNEKKAEKPQQSEGVTVFNQSPIPLDSSKPKEFPISEEKIKNYSAKKSDSDIAADAAIRALNEAHSSVASIRHERMRQAKLAFNAALVLMIIGVVIIFVGIGIVVIGNNVESGILTVVSGAVSEIVSALLFRFNKEANNRLDETRKELSRIEMSRLGLSLAKEISDLEKRDDAIVQLAQKVQTYD